MIDVVTDRCDGRGLIITGFVAGIHDRQIFVPIERLTCLEDAVMVDSVAGFDEGYQRRPTELLLTADVLGRRLLDVRIAKLVCARDIELIRHQGRWMVAGV
ncbi:MAG TPA: hypothetical protein VED43_18470, partial [Mycobacterium sp.]|nr:hypothetical protein [Mycobacterium sp.]